jgi:hypothetical protein
MAKKTKSAKKAAKAAKKAAKKAEKSKTKVDRRPQPRSIDISDPPNTDVNRGVQDLHGQAVDSASRTAGSFEGALRNTIEKQPYTAVAIALGLAWLFGRMHRPL